MNELAVQLSGVTKAYPHFTLNNLVRFPEICGTMFSPTVHWSTTATVLILLEIGIIAVMLAAAFPVQSHKRDFV